MDISEKEKDSEKREHPRIKYSGHIFFTTPEGFFEGDLINYSQNGLYIRTTNILMVGEIITFALPYLDGHVKRRGKVVWANESGFGVELQREP
jgi:hypothetical protein